MAKFFSWCLSIHVRIAQLPHERVRTDHLLDSHPYRELGIPITKLVNIDGDNIGVIVKLYESLKSLSLEPGLHLYQSFLLHLLNSLLDGTLVTDGCSEHTQSSVLDILGQVRLNLLQFPLNPGVSSIFKCSVVSCTPGSGTVLCHSSLCFSRCLCVATPVLDILG